LSTNDPTIGNSHASALESIRTSGPSTNQGSGGVSEEFEEVRKQGNKATNAAEKTTPFGRWLEEPKQDGPWYLDFGIAKIHSFDEAEVASVQEGVGNGEA